MDEAPGAPLDDFVSAPAVIITSYIQKWFPDSERDLTVNQLNGLQAQVTGRVLCSAWHSIYDPWRR